MRSRGRADLLRRHFPNASPGMDLDKGVLKSVPLESRRWRNKVAWTVTLCVLLGVLVWVGGGGLDIQPSSSSDQVQHAEVWRTLTPGDTERTNSRVDYFEGEVSLVLKKSAVAKGLKSSEIEEARVAATIFVREALRKPGGLPPPSPVAMFSGACGLQVEGLPLYHDNGQRCCMVSQMSLPKQLQALGGRGAADAAVPVYGFGEVTGGMAGHVTPQGRRGLEGEAGGGKDLSPGVLRMRRTEAVEGEEVACFPSFIIAGTQKSGTTALTGILEKHPQVMMAERKELHFFDNRTPNPRSAEIYVSHFARFNASQATEHRAPFVVGEATPFYLASRNACMNIRKMLPNVRLVVLVRDPVKRSYSEHQMKVRRVEEQGEILDLLPLHAKVIYDCAVKALPSLDLENISEREIALLSQPQALSEAIGMCAGEVGQHGKWMDAMFPFMRKLKVKSPNKAGSMEVFREAISRCFPLKTVADQMEELYPGGAWKQGWSRKLPLPPEKAGMEKTRGALRRPLPRIPDGGGGRLGHGNPGPHHRNLRNYQDYQEQRGWVADQVFLDDLESVVERYRNTTSEAAAVTIAFTGDIDNDDISSGYPGIGLGLGEGWAAAGGDAVRSVGDWGGITEDYLEGRRYADEYLYGSGARGFTREEGGGFLLEGGGFDGAAVDEDPWRRALKPKGEVMPGVPWEEVWGTWGKAGDRTFDETCYQRFERVMPAGQVMRAEMKKLKTCFESALGDLGGLEGLDEADAVAAAEALDGKLSKCFQVSPGISDQYIYRSLYGIQAYHCLKYMPRDQVMFIESDELRANPEEVMPRVHQHIGVPDFQYPSIKQDDIMAELEKKYPDFEKRTGWRLDSAYKEEIPEALAEDIREFVAPHMKMFARLTGQSFGDWAVDDRHRQEAMAGGTERPSELFEEVFDKETTRMAQAKLRHNAGVADLSEAKAAEAANPSANRESRPNSNGEAGAAPPR